MSFALYNPGLGIAGTVSTVTMVPASGLTSHHVDVQVANRLMEVP